MNKKKISTIPGLRAFLKKFFIGKNVEVYLFGSRARGTARPGADIDLAIVSDSVLSEDLTILREILEESHLPYKVDLVEVRLAPHIRKVISKEGKRWL